MKKAPIEVFDSWVTLGKDEGMQPITSVVNKTISHVILY
jgi:hypothetical protein|tara:strand:+ start:115 stop:231 length:117 start_codon:yes stop_codon:yes gene_type:complete